MMKKTIIIVFTATFIFFSSIFSAAASKESSNPASVVPSPRKGPVSDGWDVGIKFDTAHEGPFYPFSKTAGREGEFYLKKFDGVDNLYEEYVGREGCEGGYWGDIAEKEKTRRAKGWYAERRKISDDKYEISIRGVAHPDCSYDGPGYAKGELSLNPENGWIIYAVEKCSVQPSNKGQDTYCSVWQKSLKFAAGSECGGCCACADSGGLDIEVIVKNTGVKGNWPGDPIIIEPLKPTPSPTCPSPSPSPSPSLVLPPPEPTGAPVVTINEGLRKIFSRENVLFAFLLIINMAAVMAFMIIAIRSRKKI